jgi:DNA-binding response OmpR family regulator
MRVLVVDDNRDILDLLRRVLHTYGYEVSVARSGAEALQQESVLRPDVILLDVNMPLMDGWEVCRRIKARRSVPILLLTVRTEAVDIECSFAAGADEHVGKPFEIADLLARIERYAPVRAIAAPRHVAHPSL